MLFQGCSALILATVPLAILAIYSGPFRLWLPGQNSITATSGHLPIIYVILPLLPMLLLRKDHTLLDKTALPAAFIILMLSFSRAAIGIGVLLFVWTAIRDSSKRTASLVYLTVSLLATVVIAWKPSIVTTLIPQSILYVQKESSPPNTRTALSAQAVAAFREKPVMGHGIGTFILLSQRLAAKSGDISLSAHNIVLQSLAEIGLAGSLAITALLLVVVIERRKSASWEMNAALIGASVIALLGLVEQNTDRFPIFLMAGILLGIATQQEPVKKIRTGMSFPLLVGGLVIVLILYSATWIASSVAASRNDVVTAVRLAPYRTNYAIAAVSATPLTDPIHTAVLAWNPHNSQLDTAMVATYPPTLDRIPLYEKILAEHPTNLTAEREYMTTLSENHAGPLLCAELRRFTALPYLDCQNAVFEDLVTDGALLPAIGWLAGQDGKSKFMYELGLSIQPKLMTSTILLWHRAGEIAPQWSFYRLELASAIATYNHSKEAARPTLVECTTISTIRDACQYFLTHIEELPKPGYHRDEIEAIPTILRHTP
jgi:hypothetical protein